MDHTAEVARVEAGIFVCEHIRPNVRYVEDCEPARHVAQIFCICSMLSADVWPDCHGSTTVLAFRNHCRERTLGKEAVETRAR
jgi:hypothetical protein